MIGEIGGDANALGVTGIAPDARVSSVAFSMPTATAIRTAADNLQRGDIAKPAAKAQRFRPAYGSFFSRSVMRIGVPGRSNESRSELVR